MSVEAPEKLLLRIWRGMCRVFWDEALAAWDRRRAGTLTIKNEKGDDDIEKEIKGTGIMDLEIPYDHVRFDDRWKP